KDGKGCGVSDTEGRGVSFGQDAGREAKLARGREDGRMEDSKRLGRRGREHGRPLGTTRGVLSQAETAGSGAACGVAYSDASDTGEPGDAGATAIEGSQYGLDTHYGSPWRDA